MPNIYPDGFAEDNSLANQQLIPAPAPPVEPPTKLVKSKSVKPLVSHVTSRFLHHRMLVVSFTLTAKARVQLIGRRNSKVVARTHRETLKPGHHKLSLTLDPASWPTKIQFKATPLGAFASTSGDTVIAG